ncbi:unnamed protein product [Didymodactylos carnosus]|uniref:Uncharacterized protein n=1 Tax=Didymodactylos carnosus TaxID=1234261 RepID=A0A814HEY9_9BILA|nr:unnamed protein product [Didymodactylos carnosus]CAF3779324.1 unnamed protein product [Didymodactylos carnosus]
MGSEQAQLDYNSSNAFHDQIATVQLSPFGEVEWHRIITYSPIYIHWTDVVLDNNRPNVLPSVYRKSSLTSPSRTKLNIKTVDMNNLRLEDDQLLNELYDIRRQGSSTTPGLSDKKLDTETIVPAIPTATVMPQRKLATENSLKNSPVHTPTEDYKRLTGYYRVKSSEIKENNDNVNQSPKHVRSTTAVLIENTQSTIKSYSARYPDSKAGSSTYVNSIGPIKTIENLRLCPKPNPINVDSLGVQLRRSTITRESVLDRTSPLSMTSSKRHLESRRTFQTTMTDLHSSQINRRRHHQQKIANTNTPYTDRIQTNIERSQTGIIKRHTKHMLKKNDIQIHKQKINLKTILVEPWNKPFSLNSNIDESIPNSLEMMEKLGGQSTAFEKNLKFTYNKHLEHLRNIPVR